MKAGKTYLFSGLLFALALASFFSSAQAQSSKSGEQAPAVNSFTFSTTGTLANASLKGVTSDRRLFMVSSAYNRLLLHNRALQLSFTTEAIPVAILREPFIIGSNEQTLSSVRGLTEIRSAYGVGANPLGTEISFLPGRRVQPLIGFQGGFLYFSHNVLFPQAAQFNFTLNGRGGVQIPLHDGRKISVAYMFEHMSNAYMALENPGVDLQMITVGYTFPSPFGRKK